MKETGKYSVRPNSSNPMLIVMMLDCSGSMTDVMPQTGMRKCDVVATLANKMLQELGVICSKEVVKPYFDLAMLKYSGDKVSNAFEAIPELCEKPVNSICDIVDHPLRIENRVTKKMTPTGDLVDEVTEFAVWIDPMASSSTPTAAALQEASDLIVNWISAHPDAYPPVVIHITDGEATDAKPDELERLATNIKSLETEDGQTILMNAHITADPKATAVNYASSEGEVSNPWAKLMWRMSSEIPMEMAASVSAVVGNEVIKPGSRFTTFNGSEVDIARFVEVGTVGTHPMNPDPNR